jgi:hypothetical protein
MTLRAGFGSQSQRFSDSPCGIVKDRVINAGEIMSFYKTRISFSGLGVINAWRGDAGGRVQLTFKSNINLPPILVCRFIA